jgi:hypothetical protein
MLGEAIAAIAGVEAGWNAIEIKQQLVSLEAYRQRFIL